MRKICKIAIILIFLIALFSINNESNANSINSILMDIYVDNYGDAHVTETWNCKTSEGTEVYHPYYNLGNSIIRDLSVYEGNNEYTTLQNWNTSGTLQAKANKCGINKISNGVEICWGIGKYGMHEYKVNYTITNFVAELTDSQMIYWTLIPHDFSNPIGRMYIKIHTDFRIADNIDVWGYGNYGGTAYVYDGYIEMESDGRLDTNEYMTILVKFPYGTFNTPNMLDNDFQYYHDMAEEGAMEYQHGDSKNGMGIVGLIILLISIVTILTKMGREGKYNYGKEGRKIPKDTPYYRDIPCEKDLYRTYYIANQYGLLKNKTDILGAIILKWLKQSIIKIEQKEGGKIFKKENTVVVLRNANVKLIVDRKEKELFNMLYEASEDGYLESKEFERWCKKSYEKILDWFDEIILQERQKLIDEGLIVIEEKRTFGISKHKEYLILPKVKQEAMEIYGLKKYLDDYTLIKERQAIEVALFEDYLIFAQLMGIAKKVAKEFRDIYPEIIEQSQFNSYDNIYFIHMCSSRGIASANSAKSRAESYSSGGGGFSSGGGGGGSFGGGGGRRRFPLKNKSVNENWSLTLLYYYIISNTFVLSANPFRLRILCL